MPTPALSARETTLLASWERERRSRISLYELQRLVGHTAPLVATRLAAKGVLERVGRGIYAIRPLRAVPQRASSSAPVLVAHLLAGTPYYLGGLWGLTYHRLSTQQYTASLDAFVTSARRPRTLGHARIVFHVLRPAALAYGTTTATLEGVKIVVSDAERTLLDLLDFPDVAGGLLPALAMVQDALLCADLKRLVAYAARGSRTSTCQRLGVLLERASAPAVHQAVLRRRLGAPSSRLSMIPGRPRRGRLNRRWNVVENDRERGLQ